MFIVIALNFAEDVKIENLPVVILLLTGSFSITNTDRFHLVAALDYLGPTEDLILGVHYLSSGSDSIFSSSSNLAECDGSNEYSKYQMGSRNITDQLNMDLIKTDGVFHIGDISFANGYVSLWNQFTAQVEPNASTVVLVPYMIASGSHERIWPGTGSFYDTKDSSGECGILAQTMFDVSPDNRAKYWYSTDYGMFHFCIADSTTECDWREGSDRFIEHCSIYQNSEQWLRGNCTVLFVPLNMLEQKENFPSLILWDSEKNLCVNLERSQFWREPLIRLQTSYYH